MTDAETDADAKPIRMWLVERTYSDDEQNMVILTYATTDGERYFRKGVRSPPPSPTSGTPLPRSTPTRRTSEPSTIRPIESGTRSKPNGWRRLTLPTT